MISCKRASNFASRVPAERALSTLSRLNTNSTISAPASKQASADHRPLGSLCDCLTKAGIVFVLYSCTARIIPSRSRIPTCILGTPNKSTGLNPKIQQLISIEIAILVLRGGQDRCFNFDELMGLERSTIVFLNMVRTLMEVVESIRLDTIHLAAKDDSGAIELSLDDGDPLGVSVDGGYAASGASHKIFVGIAVVTLFQRGAGFLLVGPIRHVHSPIYHHHFLCICPFSPSPVVVHARKELRQCPSPCYESR